MIQQYRDWVRWVFGDGSLVKALPESSKPVANILTPFCIGVGILQFW